MRLTEQEREILVQITRGEQLIAHFDDGGVRWALEPSGTDVAFQSVEAMVDQCAIVLGEPRRIGHRRFEAKYALTEIGRRSIPEIESC